MGVAHKGTMHAAKNTVSILCIYGLCGQQSNARNGATTSCNEAFLA